jgi:hypothetical protein
MAVQRRVLSEANTMSRELIEICPEEVMARLHIARRAGLISSATRELSDHQWVTTRELAAITATSTQFWEIKRHRGGGPKYETIGGCIRYRWGAIRAWLDTCTRARTDEYARKKTARGIVSKFELGEIGDDVPKLK